MTIPPVGNSFNSANPPAPVEGGGLEPEARRRIAEGLDSLEDLSATIKRHEELLTTRFDRIDKLQKEVQEGAQANRAATSELSQSFRALEEEVRTLEHESFIRRAYDKINAFIHSIADFMLSGFRAILRKIKACWGGC